MKIIHISSFDICGGAARAAYRLHRSLLNIGLSSQMLVRHKQSDDWTVQGSKNKFEKFVNMIRPAFGACIDNMQKTNNQNLHSGNWLSSNFAKKINTSDVDVVNLHWINNETISIEDISKIEKPIVWTLHDMWPFCGSEHYIDNNESLRWCNGYTKYNRCVGDKGIDIDRLVWKRKQKSWKNKKFNIVTPSKWMSNCARESLLFKDMPISIIPNALDTQIYKPINKVFCRDILGLPKDKYIILLGAMGGVQDPRKGYDLLLEALNHLSKKIDPESVVCAVFGQSKPEIPINLPFPTYWLGRIHDDITLSLIYNSATVMVVPSRQDNLPQTATEAQSCGVPVVAFNNSGLTDIVVNHQSGYLAKSFDTFDMANGLQWILEDSDSRNSLEVFARDRAISLWKEDVIAEKYYQYYKSIIV
ncbi:glycosyltransferase family 4 protein [Edwardsiella tarda]